MRGCTNLSALSAKFLSFYHLPVNLSYPPFYFVPFPLFLFIVPSFLFYSFSSFSIYHTLLFILSLFLSFYFSYPPFYFIPFPLFLFLLPSFLFYPFSFFYHFPCYFIFFDLFISISFSTICIALPSCYFHSLFISWSFYLSLCFLSSYFLLLPSPSTYSTVYPSMSIPLYCSFVPPLILVTPGT